MSALASYDALALNMSEIFRLEHFAQDGEPVRTGLSLSVNGIELVHEVGKFETSGVLSRGQVAFPVGNILGKVVAAYSNKTKP